MQEQDKLINKGWNHMKVILDKEMPQDRKSKRFLWLVLPLLLLVSGIVWSLSHNAIKLNRTSSLLDDKVASTYNTRFKDQEKTNIDLKQQPVLTTKFEDYKYSINDLAVLYEKEKLELETINQFYHSSQTNEIENMVISNGNELKPIVSINNKEIEQNSNVKLLSNLYSPFSLLNMNNNPLKKIDTKKLLITPTIKIDSKSNNQKLWAFDLHAGIGSYNLKKMHSFNFGLQLSRRLGNKVELYSGLAYESLYTPKVFPQDKSSIPTGVPTVTGDNMGSKSNTFKVNDNELLAEIATNNVDTHARNIPTFYAASYVSMPLGVKYNLSNRWSVNAHTAINYLTTLKQNPSTVLPILELDQLNVNRYFLTYHLGINYNITRRLHVGLTYQYNNKIYFNNQKEIFGLQLGYRIW